MFQFNAFFCHNTICWKEFVNDIIVAFCFRWRIQYCSNYHLKQKDVYDGPELLDMDNPHPDFLRSFKIICMQEWDLIPTNCCWKEVICK